MYGGECFCKNANETWDFLEHLSDKTYEWKTIREASSYGSLIFIPNRGKLSINVVFVKRSWLIIRVNLEFLIFFLLNLMIMSLLHMLMSTSQAMVLALAFPLTKMSYESVSEPSLPPLMIILILRLGILLGVIRLLGCITLSLSSLERE